MTDAGTAPRRHVSRIVLGIVSVLVLIATVIGAGYSVVKSQLQGNITAVDVSENIGPVSVAEPLNTVDETTGKLEPVTVVLMGSDTRAGKGNGGFGSASQIGGERSDTTIVLHIAGDRKSAIALSIPRDTWITLPTCKKDGKKVGGGQGRFNQAIELGGPGCTLKAIRELTGIDVKNFMLVDFGGFKRIVDAIGGVEVCLTEPVDDKASGLNLSAGKHVVDGNQALAFVRARKSLGDGSDTSRIRRQQAFIASLMRQVMSSGTLLNPAALLGVLDAATKSLTADPQMANIDNLKDLALSLKDLRPNDVTFVTMPWTPNSDGATVTLNKDKAQPIFEAIKNDTAWPPKGSSGEKAVLLKTPPENIRVNVLNGTTTPNLGKKVAKQLKKQGYIVQDISNADTTDYTQTTVEYSPDYDMSAKTLAASTGAQVLDSKKKLGGTLNLIVGSDFTAVVPVEISDIASDYTAQVNSGDENFCAK
jgi:LCP family protein required for cell wall assembly